MVDTTLIVLPSSAKDASGDRAPQIRPTKTGNQGDLRMRAHVGVGARSDPVHRVAGTTADVDDATQAGWLRHGQEDVAFGDAGCQGVHRRPEAAGPARHFALRLAGPPQPSTGAAALADEPAALRGARPPWPGCADAS